MQKLQYYTKAVNELITLKLKLVNELCIIYWYTAESCLAFHKTWYNNFIKLCEQGWFSL